MSSQWTGRSGLTWSRRSAPGLLASDVDGTLLRSNGTVSTRTRAAIATLHRASLPLALVTGRAPRWLPPVLAETAFAGKYVVCCNGALLYSCHERRVTASHLLGIEEIRDLIDRIEAIVPDAGFAVEYGDRFAYEPRYVPRWDIGLPTVTRVHGIEELTSRAAAKLLVRHRTLTIDELMDVGRSAAADLAMVTHGSGDVRLEISARNVDKATGLALVASELGVPAHRVAAIGDMPNDVSMLDWAGSSYAVANAHPEVRCRVDEIVPSNDDDGVATVIERWLDQTR
ncbi:Cof-type HAD-IIB family hydrolase [Actinoallomurus acanthiterrae]